MERARANDENTQLKIISPGKQVTLASCSFSPVHKLPQWWVELGKLGVGAQPNAS